MWLAVVLYSIYIYAAIPCNRHEGTPADVKSKHCVVYSLQCLSLLPGKSNVTHLYIYIYTSANRARIYSLRHPCLDRSGGMPCVSA